MSSKQHRKVHIPQIRLPYLLFLPEGYGSDPEERWPLILFLHGAGERGNRLSLIKKHGLPKIVEKEPDFPFVVVSPQCPSDHWWWDYTLILKCLLDEVVADHAVDPSRIYLTGISMGGYGVWNMAMAYPDLFAAVAPICGGGVPDMIEHMKSVPVWAFHGAEDQAVPVERGQQMVDALKAVGGTVRFTVYPGVGHDSWTRTYENPALYQWFLQWRRVIQAPEI